MAFNKKLTFEGLQYYHSKIKTLFSNVNKSISDETTRATTKENEITNNLSVLETNLGDLKKEEVDNKIESEVATDFSQADTPQFQQTIDDALNEVSELKSDLDNYYQKETEVVIAEAIEHVDGKARSYTGSTFDGNYSYSKYSTEGLNGKTIKVTGMQVSSEYCLIYETDENNEVLSGRASTIANGVQTDYEWTVSKLAKFVYVNGRNATLIPQYSPIIKKENELPFDDAVLKATKQKLFISDSDILIDILNKDIIALQKKNDFAWNDYDKAYITFSFDDGYADISDVVSLFATKNVPCCLSIPTSRFDVVSNNGKTVLEVAKDCVENGGEILGHGFQVLTDQSTDEQYIAQFKYSKFEYVKNGLNVRGYMAVGGTDEHGRPGSSCNFAKAVECIRPYYEYSDYYGQGTGITQYSHNRNFFSDLATAKADVDRAITNKQWLSFASHTLDSSIVSELIDYILSKGNTQVEIVTFAYLYDNFGTTKLEKRLSALESIN